MEDDDEDLMNTDKGDLGVGLSAPSGGPEDYRVGIGQLQREMVDAQKRASMIRKQQLAAATEALRTRRMGPSTAEQLFALSAAFASPSRVRGFAGVMGNVMPVLGQMAAAQRTGTTEREDKLRELQTAYQNEEISGEQGSIAQRLALLKAAMAGTKIRSAIDPTTGLVKNLDTGEAIIPGAEGLPRPRTKEERDALPAGAKYVDPMGRIKRKIGGQTGATPSGGFR